MKSKKRLSTLILLLLSMLLGSLFLFISIYIPNQKELLFLYYESNTIERKATVKNIELSHNQLYIETEEFNFKLMAKKEYIVNWEYLEYIEPGTAIHFRVPSPVENLLEDDSLPQLAIVSLRAGDTQIITLESFNLFMKSQDKKMQITGIVGSVFFYLVALICIVLLAVRRKRKEQT